MDFPHPRSLDQMLSEDHRTEWEPKFRAHLQDHDDDPDILESQRIRVALLDYVLLLHKIKNVLKRELDSMKMITNHDEFQNVVNEKRDLLKVMQTTYLDPETKIGLAFKKPDLQNRLGLIVSEQVRYPAPRLPTDVSKIQYNHALDLADVIKEIHTNDDNVWKRLSSYYDEFVIKLDREKESSLCKATQSVLLSIL